MKHGWRQRRLCRARGLIAGLVVLVTASGMAGAADVSNAVSRSYGATAAVQAGMIVGHTAKNAATVTPLTLKSINDMFGVVVPISDTEIYLGSQSAGQVLVTTSGQHDVLVSNQNGPIKRGDYVTISSLEGVGMKADSRQTRIIGRALSDFSGTGNVAGTTALKGSLGHSTTVALTRIPVDINVADNPLNQSTNNIRGFLTRTANGLANKPVSQIRVYLSLAVLLGTLFVTGNMLYGAVRGGTLAIGRNPLAKKSIMRSLSQVTLLSLAVFAGGILAVYLILNY
jgi:hypothetical protein